MENKGWWSKGLQTFFFSGEGFLTSDFDSEKSSFLFFDGCSVVWWLTFPFSLPSFSLPFLYSSFLFTLESSFSSDSSDLWVKWKKKFLMVLQGIKVWSLSGLSSGSSLKFALSRLINFLISHNNTTSQSIRNLKRRKKIIRSEDKLFEWTPYSQRYCHNTCETDSKENWFQYLGGERTYPFKGAHGVIFSKTIPQLVTTH